VLIAGAWARSDRDELFGWLGLAFARETGEDWRLRDPARLGLAGHPGPDDRDTARPFLVTIGPWQADEHDEEAELVDAIGYQPGTQITLCAMVNSDYDHLVLGHLALALARRYDALVDLGGPLPVPRPPGSTWPHSWQDEPQQVAATRTVIASLPGRVYEIAYRTVTGGTWVHHLVDARFLAEWLAHPDFRMVK
jgi:hypothetical protein